MKLRIEETLEGPLGPTFLRTKLIDMSHSVHMAGDTIHNPVKKCWFGPNLKNKLIQRANSCINCHKNKKSKSRQANVELIEMYSFEPGELWSSDLCKSIKKTDTVLEALR